MRTLKTLAALWLSLSVFAAGLAEEDGDYSAPVLINLQILRSEAFKRLNGRTEIVLQAKSSKRARLIIRFSSDEQSGNYFLVRREYDGYPEYVKVYFFTEREIFSQVFGKYLTIGNGWLAHRYEPAAPPKKLEDDKEVEELARLIRESYELVLGDFNI